MIDRKAKSRWERLDIALQNYLTYIKSTDKYELTFIDLLHISNFKGGNSSITENVDRVNEKIKNHSVLLKKIRKIFKSSNLGELDDKDFGILNECINDMIYLSKDQRTSIKGFGVSYFSALYHAHFPNLIPILDRRMLCNSKILDYREVEGKQIKNIEKYYKKLMQWNKDKMNEAGKTLREIDREYFVKDFKHTSK